MFNWDEPSRTLTVSNGISFIGANGLFHVKSVIDKVKHIVYANGTKTVYGDNLNEYPNLLTVTLPDSVQRIGEDAFMNCRKLKSVNLPDRISVIEANAFCNCSALESITVPYRVEEIADGTFSGCFSLKNVTLPATLKNIGAGAFCNCSALEAITLPYGLTKIDGNTFEGCYSLREISMPDSITAIGASAFEKCSRLPFLRFPAKLVKIGENAFASSGLQSVVIGSQLQSIGKNAFQDCDNLTELTITYGYLHNWQNCFGDTARSIRSVVITGNPTAIPDNAFRGCSALQAVAIPDSVEKIGSYAFAECGLTQFAIPSGIETIANGTFYRCRSLQNVYIPKSVTAIGSHAFSSCSALTQITVPASVTAIGSQAFSGCSALPQVTVPDSVTEIGDMAFDGCTEIRDMTLPEAFSKSKELNRICGFKLSFRLRSGTFWGKLTKNARYRLNVPQSEAEIKPPKPKKVSEETDTSPLALFRTAKSRVTAPNILSVAEHISLTSEKILTYTQKHPKKQGQIASLLTFYLPTATEHLTEYADLEQFGSHGENAQTAKAKIAETLASIAESCDTLLDSLFADTVTKIEADDTVIDYKRKMDNLTENKDFSDT